MISVARLPLTRRINKLIKGSNVGILSMNNPPVNSLNPEFISEFTKSIRKVGQDNSLAAVIIRSDLPSVFSAGLDLSYVMINEEETDAEARSRLKLYFHSFQELLKELLLVCLCVLLFDGKTSRLHYQWGSSGRRNSSFAYVDVTSLSSML